MQISAAPRLIFLPGGARVGLHWVRISSDHARLGAPGARGRPCRPPAMPLGDARAGGQAGAAVTVRGVAVRQHGLHDGAGVS